MADEMRNIRSISEPLSPNVFPVIKLRMTGRPFSYHFRYTSR